MLVSELMDNLKQLAPDAYSVIWKGELSTEHQGAYLDAMQAIYQSRSGDALFSGADRHAKLALYIGSEQGWTRVQRLAGNLYRKTWGKAEAERLERARLEKLRKLEYQVKEKAREMAQQQRALDHWTDERSDARSALTRAETEVAATKTSLAATEKALQELHKAIQEVGPASQAMAATAA